jgi:chromosome segregation ATPase
MKQLLERLQQALQRITELPLLKKKSVPIIALALGLVFGLGIGFMKLNAEQNVFQEKMKEANKKIAYLQKKMSEDKNETIALEQRCQADLTQVKQEKSVAAGQLKKAKEQAKTLEANLKSSEEAIAATKKELRETAQKKSELDLDLKKTTTEKQALQGELKKRSKELTQCSTNNAELSMLSEELVSKYRNKGLGSLLLEQEPITQVKKVELEKLTQQYQEDIEQLKLKKKEARGKNENE